MGEEGVYNACRSWSSNGRFVRNPTDTAIVWPWLRGPMSWDVAVEAAGPPMTTVPDDALTVGIMPVAPLKANSVIARTAAIRLEFQIVKIRLLHILNQ